MQSGLTTARIAGRGLAHLKTRSDVLKGAVIEKKLPRKQRRMIVCIIMHCIIICGGLMLSLFFVIQQTCTRGPNCCVLRDAAVLCTRCFVCVCVSLPCWVALPRNDSSLVAHARFECRGQLWAEKQSCQMQYTSSPISDCNQGVVSYMMHVWSPNNG